MELVKRSNAYQKASPNYHWISRGAINCKSNELPSLDLHCIVQCLALHSRTVPRHAMPCIASPRLETEMPLGSNAGIGTSTIESGRSQHRSLPNPALENHDTWRPKHPITSKSGPGDLPNPLKCPITLESTPGDLQNASKWTQVLIHLQI